MLGLLYCDLRYSKNGSLCTSYLLAHRYASICVIRCTSIVLRAGELDDVNKVELTRLDKLENYAQAPNTWSLLILDLSVLRLTS